MGSEEEDRGEDGHCGGFVGVEDEKKMCATREDKVEGGAARNVPLNLISSTTRYR